jgi:predicted metal-dependent phosphotriesterase family hydrolase
MQDQRGLGLSRRDAIRLLGTGAGLGLAAQWLDGPSPAFGQPGAWFGATSPSRATFPKGSVIRTVVKDIAPEDFPVGAIQMHAHVGGIFEKTPPPPDDNHAPGVVAPANEAEYLTLMVEELKMAKAEGVACLVDPASSRKRDEHTLENLKQISTRSGVNIVLGGGYYQDLALSARYPAAVVSMPEDQLAQEFVRDSQSQRWGAFGEIASSQTMQPEERKVLRAIGKAHVRTALPIFTHTPHQSCPSCAIEQLDVFESVGVKPNRTCIGHLTAIRPNAEPIGQTAKAIAKRGAFLGFDTVGHAMAYSFIPEQHKVKLVLAMLEAGYEDNLLFSADSTPVAQFKANWGQGYGSVITQFVPKLRYAGVSDKILHKILVDNPRRFLAFVPPART